MPERNRGKNPNRVRLVEVPGRKIQLRYRCPDSGKEVRVSTGTYDLDEATELKLKYEAKLRLGLPLNDQSASQSHGPQMDWELFRDCLLYTSPSPRDATLSRMPSSA